MPAALILALAALLAPAPSKVWTSLFDGKTLNGWEPAGKARWVVEDGAIVGRQGEGGAAGDLFTTELYDSFEAEAEWSMNWPGNSGLWFKYQGPGTGCQADILDEPAEAGILSGSIYCIGKRFIAENRASMPGSVSDRMYNYFNGAAFTRPATDAIGSAPRSLNYRAPGIRSADMALGKQFAVNERMHGEFRLEMQNATNTPGFGAPSAAFGSSSFGVISGYGGARGPRTVQLGTKFVF